MYLKMRMHYVADNHEPETCALCILEYPNGDIIGKLQCEHEFHVGCIKKWLLRKKICPLCRGSAVPGD
ncbi:hypothetical protein R3W88_032798 [Solanum pinnatisectum]|uniref:RING-type E3 ubiquitin transferase n=1 Tax=Solanum pinnatisectum TaxID=50273 RepID=A0AAV9LQ74_9SOLN|nr:hypothetical protein R3W88_032798 [Solanum pinnatisectum]